MMAKSSLFRPMLVSVDCASPTAASARCPRDSRGDSDATSNYALRCLLGHTVPKKLRSAIDRGRYHRRCGRHAKLPEKSTPALHSRRRIRDAVRAYPDHHPSETTTSGPAGQPVPRGDANDSDFLEPSPVWLI